MNALQTLSLPTGRRGRALALALALLAAVVLWLGVAAPLIGWYEARQETLRRQLAIGHRMAALVRTLPALQAAAEAAAARGALRRETLLDGATDQVAAATLQQRLDEMANHAGLRIGSVEVLPPEAVGAYRMIGVQVTVTAPWPALVALLQAIAGSDTPMLADNLQLRGQPRGPQDTEAPIDANLNVIGYRSGKAPAEDASAGAAGGSAEAPADAAPPP